MQGNIRFKHRVENAFLRATGRMAVVLPYRIALAVGWLFAALTHHVFRFRASEARRRIRVTLGDQLSARRIRRCAWISWRNVCFNAVEILRMPRLDHKWIQRHMSGLDDFTRHIRSLMNNNGGLLAAPHMGNWDLGGVCCHLHGVPIFFIARRQKNPLTDKYLNQLRGATGVTTILNDSRVLHKVIRRLKREKEIMAILPDVRARQKALDISFLGGQANIGGGMGLFARQANVPILPAYAIREGWTRHRLILLPAVYPDSSLDRKADWQRMTQEIMSGFEKAIRTCPEQYFWYNKRWILDPLPPENEDPQDEGK